MGETTSGAAEKVCTVCKANSSDRILLNGISKDKEVWVCVKCLPVLIHGGH